MGVFNKEQPSMWWKLAEQGSVGGEGTGEQGSDGGKR